MPTTDEISEQMMAAILDRIKSEATISGKVRALVDAIDWIRSIQVNTDGAEPGRLTRFQQIFVTVAVSYFFNAIGQNDPAREFQEIASTLSDLVAASYGRLRKKGQRGPAVLNPSPLTFGERKPMWLPRSIR